MKGVIFLLLLGMITAQEVQAQVWPNEPAGATVITDNPFNCIVCNGWDQVNVTSMFLSSDATAPLSPSNVLQFRYDVGFTGGKASGTVFYYLNNLSEVYVGFWWKPDANWEGLAGGQKINFFFGGNPYAYELVMLLNGQFSGWPQKINIYFPINDNSVRNTQVVPSRCDPYVGTCQIYANVNDVTITLGAWHRLEWYIKHSTTTTSQDGVLRWWIDGVLAGNHTNVNFPSPLLTVYEFSPTWNGTTDTVSRQFSFWYDQVHLSKGGSGGGTGDTTPPVAPSGLRLISQLWDWFGSTWDALVSKLGPAEAAAEPLSSRGTE